MIAFEIPASISRDLRERIWKKARIETAVTSAAGKRFLRVSAAWFNAPEDIDRLEDALRPMLRKR
jgi:selenocysteine lyase/cysteine desulfurase